MKRWVSLFLTLAFLVSFVPLFQAQAVGQTPRVSISSEAVKAEAETGVYMGMEYSIFFGKVTITGYTGDLPDNLVVPKTIEGLPVTTIGDHAFSDCDKLTTVYMPNVTTIDECAFGFCDALTTVDVPAVTTIGDRAFYSCDMLTAVDIPAVTTIGEEAFAWCNALVVINMPVVAIIESNAFYNCEALTTVHLHAVEHIRYCAFARCPSLTAAYFYSDAPSYCAIGAFSESARNFTIYFAAGTEGWTAPEWNGYPAQEFIPEGYCKVTLVDGAFDWVISIELVASGEDVALPAPYEHDGYIFIGWSHDGKNITANITITAQYEKSIYTVTFVDGLSGETISTQSVEYDSDATFPTPPEHEGYTFTDWDKDGKNITADTTITAQYEKNKYTVTFIDGYSGETISTQTVEFGSDATFPEPPEHEGYTFTGWDKDGRIITEDTTITAQYEKNVLEGDVTGDGRLNTGDVVMILRYNAGLITFTEDQKALADFNKDGRLNTGDAVAVLRYCAGL